MVGDHDLGVPNSGLHLKAPETLLKARLLSRKEAFEILETTNDQEGNIWFVTVTLNREDRRGNDTEVTIEGFRTFTKSLRNRWIGIRRRKNCVNSP